MNLFYEYITLYEYINIRLYNLFYLSYYNILHIFQKIYNLDKILYKNMNLISETFLL